LYRREKEGEGERQRKKKGERNGGREKSIHYTCTLKGKVKRKKFDTKA